jgi:hypothetical protein
LQPLEPLERLERRVQRVPRVQLRPGLKEQQGLVALLAQQPERAEQQVQVPLGELQQELGE